ncbi:MAG: amidohydrolase family protein, partial [Firmicutes bacterium]|nr:amidohydrolase family protein [Bacillota bacterium]
MKDLVIFNGQINTMDPRIPYAEALAVKDGKIITVGSNEDVKKAMPFGAEVIDAKGNSVFPGFFDTHVHLTFAGLNMTGVKLEKARSKEELIDILKTAEKELSPGMWLRGTGYDETIYPGRSMLTMKELDEAFGPRPVMLERIDA